MFLSLTSSLRRMFSLYVYTGTTSNFVFQIPRVGSILCFHHSCRFSFGCVFSITTQLCRMPISFANWASACNNLVVSQNSFVRGPERNNFLVKKTDWWCTCQFVQLIKALSTLRLGCPLAATYLTTLCMSFPFWWRYCKASSAPMFCIRCDTLTLFGGWCSTVYISGVC
jgi:hypothetical protein